LGKTEIKNYADLENKERLVALEYLRNISDKQGWNTEALLNHTLSLKKDTYGCYIGYEKGEISGFFIISDQDGDNEQLDNFKKYQKEDEAFWICSVFVDNNYMLLTLFFEKIGELLKNKPTYIYFENERLKKLLKRKFLLEDLYKDKVFNLK